MTAAAGMAAGMMVEEAWVEAVTEAAETAVVEMVAAVKGSVVVVMAEGATGGGDGEGGGGDGGGGEGGGGDGGGGEGGGAEGGGDGGGGAGGGGDGEGAEVTGVEEGGEGMAVEGSGHESGPPYSTYAVQQICDGVSWKRIRAGPDVVTATTSGSGNGGRVLPE